jgi:hypothetical protein
MGKKKPGNMNDKIGFKMRIKIQSRTLPPSNKKRSNLPTRRAPAVPPQNHGHQNATT